MGCWCSVHAAANPRHATTCHHHRLPERKKWTKEEQVQITRQSTDMLCACTTSNRQQLMQQVRDNICSLLGISDGSKGDLPVNRASLPVQVRVPPCLPTCSSHSLWRSKECSPISSLAAVQGAEVGTIPATDPRVGLRGGKGLFASRKLPQGHVVGVYS